MNDCPESQQCVLCVYQYPTRNNIHTRPQTRTRRMCHELAKFQMKLCELCEFRVAAAFRMRPTATRLEEKNGQNPKQNVNLIKFPSYEELISPFSVLFCSLHTSTEEAKRQTTLSVAVSIRVAHIFMQKQFQVVHHHHHAQRRATSVAPFCVVCRALAHTTDKY